MANQKGGDIMGKLSELPTEPVYTPAERAAAMMLDALNVMLYERATGDTAYHAAESKARAAIVAAERAGIKRLAG